MGWIDIFLIILLVAACMLGYSEGFIGQFTSLGGIVLGIIAVWIFGEPAGALIGSFIGADEPDATAFIRYVAIVSGCIIVFLVTWTCIWSVGRLFSRLIRVVRLTFIDGFFGAIFMVFKCSLAISLVLNIWHFFRPSSVIFFSARFMDGKFFNFFMQFGTRLVDYFKLPETNLLPSAL